MRIALALTVLLSVGTLGIVPSSPVSADQTQEIAVGFSLVSDDFDLPVHIAANPFRPEELLVVERDGLVKRLHITERSIRELLDIEGLINETHPHGLLSLAYSNKVEGGVGEFFVNYIDTQGDLVLARFPDRKGVLVDDEQMTVILKIAQISRNTHGSQIHMNADDTLLLTTGDGEETPQTTTHSAQSTKSLLGKVLRVTPQHPSGYAVPSDNPLPRTPTTLPEIWALGFRNPEHISVNPASGEVFVIDNGPSWHEINVVQPGRNYGWDSVEGDTCRTQPCSKESLISPVIKIERNSPRSRLIGGLTYRGKEISALQGDFIFAETTSGTLFAAEKAGDGSWRYSVLASIPKKEISTIGSDTSGEIFVATRDGSLFALTYRGGRS